MSKKRTDVYGTFKRVKSKFGGAYFVGSLEGGARAIFQRSPYYDQDGCEIWELILKEPFAKSTVSR